MFVPMSCPPASLFPPCAFPMFVCLCHVPSCCCRCLHPSPVPNLPCVVTCLFPCIVLVLPSMCFPYVCLSMPCALLLLSVSPPLTCSQSPGLCEIGRA